MLNSKFAGSLILVGCAVLLSGCGDSSAAKNYLVTGKVLYTDGTPVTSGSIVFSGDKGVESQGEIQKDGTFTLKSTAGKKEVDGCPAGSYRVHILNTSSEDIDPKETGSSKEGEVTTPEPDTAPAEIVAEKFRSPETSELKYEVKAEDNKGVDFKVEKP